MVIQSCIKSIDYDITLFMWFCCVSLSLPLEPSLTATNLCSLLGSVKDWGTSINGLPRYLRIPDSKVAEMERLYRDLSQQQSALIQFWLDTYPAPSWELVCYALYLVGEYEVLENVQNKYFKGILYMCTIYNTVLCNCLI